jgi:hypothetical protein
MTCIAASLHSFAPSRPWWRKPPKLVATSLLLGLGGFHATSGAQVATFAPDSDGARIEAEIRSLAVDCFGTFAEYGPAFLPPELKSPLRFKQTLSRAADPARQIRGVRFELLARTVLDANAPIVPQLTNASASAPIDINLPDASPVTGSDHLIYGLTCGTQLKLALDQGFQFSWALPSTASASLKQALNYQSNMDAKNSLVLMYGTFRSPLHAALTSVDAEVKARGHAAVLSYYLTESSRPAMGAPKYVKGVKGWLITRGSTRDMSTLVGASAAAGGSLFGLEANVTSSARLSYSGNFSSTNFSIILDQPLNPATDLASLPSMGAIQTAIASAVEFFPKDESTYARNGPIPVKAVLRGMPSWLCANQWDATSAPTHRVEKVQGNFNQATGVCELTTSVAPQSEVTNITVTFRNTRNLGGYAPPDARLEFVNIFPTRLLPDPRVSSLGVPTSSVDKNTSLPTFAITAPFGISPVGTSTDVTVGATPVLKCPGYSGKYYPYVNEAPVPIASGQYRINLGLSFDADAVPQVACQLEVEVSFVSNARGLQAPFTKTLTAGPLFFGSK